MASLLPVCIYCGKPIKSGRSDKKFCDAGCKDAYYNELKTNEHQEVKKIDAILKKNRRILKSILGTAKEEIVTRDELLKKGFDFDYHTHKSTSKIKGHQYLFCY